ncbi:hypothetical protein LTR08_008045 [Meristemomyces frigidus]|nr:hypothetical protein LTR08_008045 [Meristemomyces frigidus]
MALVSYSDSEGSDIESTPVVPKPTALLGNPSLSRPTNDGLRKIKVDLPNVQPGADHATAPESPPAKRAKTSGVFGGINSFLPAPKRPAAVSGLKKGVSLRTSSEAAFSRAAPVSASIDADTGDYDEFGNPRAKETQEAAQAGVVTRGEEPPEEMKVVGKATRFKPLSVSNKRKKVVKKMVQPVPADLAGAVAMDNSVSGDAQSIHTRQPPGEAALPKVKRSLFSVALPEDEQNEESAAGAGLAMESRHQPDFEQTTETASATTNMLLTAPPPNSLEAVASDLNLTAAQRRQLFGRQGEKAAINIAHFNMDSEYAANEQLRQAGETMQHQAVKSIAPGKHSLQQLVNNARRNEESIEDKWAEGRRNQGGANYGWGGGK